VISLDKYQFVKWFPIWVGFKFRSYPGAMSLIYDWYWCFSFWEIRKWHNLKNGEIETYNRQINKEDEEWK